MQALSGWGARRGRLVGGVEITGGEGGFGGDEELPFLEADMIVKGDAEGLEAGGVAAGDAGGEIAQQAMFGEGLLDDRCFAGSDQAGQEIGLFGLEVGLQLAGEEVGSAAHLRGDGVGAVG